MDGANVWEIHNQQLDCTSDISIVSKRDEYQPENSVLRGNIESPTLNPHEYKPIAHKKSATIPAALLSIRCFFFLSFHHIPQRVQLRLAEETSGVALDHRPARITLCDLTRSFGLQPVRQDLERFAVYCQGMQRPLAHYIHFGVHFRALSWFVSG
jgi:hypothetical protein